MSKVGNTEKKIDKTIEMNDKDYVNDVLASEKAMVTNMATMLIEMSNKPLHDEIFQLFKKCDDNQRKLFELLFENGWYQLESAQNTKLDQEYEKTTEMMNELEK